MSDKRERRGYRGRGRVARGRSGRTSHWSSWGAPKPGRGGLPGEVVAIDVTPPEVPEIVPPVITTQPQMTAVVVPSAATFTVVATGAVSYQWQSGRSDSNGNISWMNVSGATSSSYTTPATNQDQVGISYRCIVSNTAGSTYTSSALLIVRSSPSVTTQPVSVSVLEPATATFTVVAGGTGPFTYQWQKNGEAVGGATDASYTTGATEHDTDDGDEYRCVITNAYGSVISSAAVLTVTEIVAPTITIHPASVTVTEPARPTFTVVAVGSEPFTYQWQKNGVEIEGATEQSYTTGYDTSSDDNGDEFLCVVTNDAGSDTSDAATLTVLSSNPSDLDAPVVSVSHSPASPAENELVTITATATDFSGVEYMEITVDDVVVATSTTGFCQVPARYYSAGEHTYFATARDASGNANVGRDPTPTGTKTLTVTAATAGGGGSTYVSLTVSPVPTTTVPISGCVFIPIGEVADSPVGSPALLRLETAAGVEVAAQFRTVSKWHDGTVKSVHVSALRDGTTTSYKLYYGTGVTRSFYSSSLQVTDDTTKILVNTGVIQMQLSRAYGYLFEQLTVNGTSLLSAPADFIAEDSQYETLFKSSLWANPTLTIEEHGRVEVIVKQTGTLRSEVDTTGGGVGTTQSKVATQRSALSGGWNQDGTDLYANSAGAYLEFSMDFGLGGAWQISMEARNNDLSTAPGVPGGYAFLVNVYIDGELGDTISIPGHSTIPQTGSVTINDITAGVHTVRFTWMNDAWQPGVYDANIRVKSVTVAPAEASPQDSVDYVIRYHLYSGSDIVKVDARIIDRTTEADKAVEPTYTADGSDVNMAVAFRQLYFSLPYTLGTETVEFGTTGQLSASVAVGSDEKYLWMDGNDNVIGAAAGQAPYAQALPHNLRLVRETGQIGTDATAKAAGWYSVGDGARGVTFIVPEMWMRYPYELGVDGSTDTIKISHHPARSSDKPAISDPNGTRFQRPRSFYFPRHGGACTFRTFFAFHTGAHRGLALNNSLQTKPKWVMTAAYATASNVRGDISPPDTLSAGHDDWLTQSMTRCAVNAQSLGGGTMFIPGKRDFGCNLFNGAIRPSNTAGRCVLVNLNDTHIGSGSFFMGMYLRTGDWETWGKWAFWRAQHYMDFDISHCNRLGRINYPSDIGPGEPHNRFHNDGQKDHVVGEFNDSHGVTGGVPDYYLMDGDLFALDTLQEMGGWMKANINSGMRFPASFSAAFPAFDTNPDASEEHRNWAWSIWIMLEIWRATGDATYAAAIGKAIKYLMQWFKQTTYGRIQNGVTVHANDWTAGRAAWLLPRRSGNNATSGAWNGGSPWMIGGLLAIVWQVFDEAKTTAALLGGESLADTLEMLMQNVESMVRHQYEPTVGKTYSTNDDRADGRFWLYDESTINATVNEYGQSGDAGDGYPVGVPSGSPTTFKVGSVLGGGGLYAIARAYQVLKDGDPVVGAYSHASWMTTQNAERSLWADILNDAAADLKLVRSYDTTADTIRSKDAGIYGFYGYENVWPLDALKLMTDLGAGTLPIVTYTPRTGVVPPGGGTGWQLTFEDNFDGAFGTAPSSARWNITNNYPDYIVSPRHAINMASNVYLDGNGNLAIDVRKQSVTSGGQTYQYTTGRIDTGRMYDDLKFSQAYGAWEVKAKLPVGAGIAPEAMWMESVAHIDFATGISLWPSTGEFDVGEFYSQASTTIKQNMLHPAGWGSGFSYPNSLPSGTVDGQFHVYRLEWSATEVVFFIDGVEKTRIPRASWWNQTINNPPFVGYAYDLPFYITVNVHVGLGGTPDPNASYPKTMLVDYVRVYERV